MGYSARRVSVNALEQWVEQTNHGFFVGQVLTYNGTNYVLAKANSLANCKGVVMVSQILDVNHFLVVQDGFMTGLPLARVPGTQYYVDPVNAGSLTSVMPSASGDVILPCFVATSSFDGYFQSNAAELIESGPMFSWNVVTTNTVMSVNTGYFTNSASGAITMLLPTVASVGDTIKIANVSDTGTFTVTQNASPSQQIDYGNQHTTAGSGGSIASLNIGDAVTLVCYSANTFFIVTDSVGNFTIV